MSASSGFIPVSYEGINFTRENLTETLQGGTYIVYMTPFFPSSSQELFSIWMVDPNAGEGPLGDFFEPVRDINTGMEVAQGFCLRLTVRPIYIPDGWCLAVSTNSQTPNPLAKVGYTKL